MAYQQILYEVKDRIATITFNRPEQLNIWNDLQTDELWTAANSAAEDKEVRVIVISGAGRAFSAGADVSAMGKHDPRHLIEKQKRLFDMNRRADYQTRHSYFPAIPKPIIAMINGPAIGLGLLYAMFADVRFAAEDAVISTAFSRIGLSAEYGTAWILERLVGHANALDLLISGRKVRAPEALRMGLVNQVYPRETLARETYAYAGDIAELVSPRSARVLKLQVWDLPFQSLAQAVISANADMLSSIRCADHKEGTSAFLEKRKPNFPGE